MRTATYLLCVVILATLFTGLGFSAQEPTIAVRVGPGFRVDSNGCISPPKTSSVWTITGGDWVRPEVQGYLKRIDPFLNEERRKFDWHGMGPGSGIYVFGTDHLCGFSASKTDASLALEPVTPQDIQDLRDRADADSRAAIKAGLWVAMLGFFLLVAVIIMTILALSRSKQRKDYESQVQTLIEGNIDAGAEAEARHRGEILALDKRYEAFIEDLRNKHAVDIATVHDLYTPVTGPPVVAGGLTPDLPLNIEGNMLRTTYEDLPIAAHLPYGDAARTGLFRRIGPILYGLLSGHVQVRDADGKQHPKIFHNQPGYQTDVVLPDGDFRTVYSLAACCNPVTTGNWMEGAADDFTFTLMATGALVAPTPPITPLGIEAPQELTTPAGGRILIYPAEHEEVAVDGNAEALQVTIKAAAGAAETPQSQQKIETV